MIKFSEYKLNCNMPEKKVGSLLKRSMLVEMDYDVFAYIKYLSIFKGSNRAVVNHAIKRLINDIELDLLDNKLDSK